MADNNLEELVSGLVNKSMSANIEALRNEFRADLAPVRLTLRSHSMQMRDIRKTGAETAAAVSKLEGVVESTEENRRADHKENSSKLDAVVEWVTKQRGVHEFVSGQEETSARKRTAFREWLRVGLSASAIGGIYKGIHEWWVHHRPPH